MDLLDDDLFSEPAAANSRAGGKFQPKAKPRPKKIMLTSVSSTLPSTAREQPTVLPSSGPETTQLAHPVDVVDHKLVNSVGSSADALGVSRSEGPSKDNETSFSDGTRSLELVNSSSQVHVTIEDAALENAQSAKVLMFDSNSILKSAGEVDSMGIGLDPFADDLLPEPVTGNARAGGKFLPKVKPRPRKDSSASVTSDICNVTKEKPTIPAASAPDTPNDVVISSLATSQVHGAKEPSENNEVSCSGVVDTSSIPGAKDAIDSKNAITDSSGCSAGENAYIFSGLEVLEEIQPSNRMASKTHHVHMGAEHGNKFQKSDSVGHAGEGSLSDPHASEVLANEEPTNQAEKSPLDDAVLEDLPHSEDVPLGKTSARSRKRKTSTVSDHSQKSKKSSIAGEDNEGGKSSRKLRERLHHEPDDQAPDNGGFHAGTPSNSAVDEEDGDDEHREGSKSRKKRTPRKKPVAENEKPVKKRKSANKETDQSIKQPPKKFSHSTRRTRRQVDKTLLETPEDELDVMNLPIRDLIMLYLHKDQIENKEAKSKRPSTNQSADSAFHNEARHSEEETSDTEQNGDFTDNQGGAAVQMTSPYFNYQSYMDKTRSAKWSKQDDELFYKGIQQFGIDLSMIQLLFPDRTRRQIKLKLKKEERQHPLKLTEAVQNRAKDHSHFELVIERLKQASNQAEEDFDGSESAGVTGEEDAEELTPENNDEATKPEDEDAEGNEREEGTTQVDSPSQLDEIENDELWNDYISEY